MERLEKITESYAWIEKIAGRTIVEFSKTIDMLEESHSRFFEQYELSNTRFNVLLILYKKNQKEPMYMSQIGERMLLSSANITGLVDRLEKQGFAKRVRSSKDRRKIGVEITDEGIVCLEEVIDDYIIWSERLMKTLDTDEKEEFVQSLKKLQTGIIEMEKENLEMIKEISRDE